LVFPLVVEFVPSFYAGYLHGGSCRKRHVLRASAFRLATTIPSTWGLIFMGLACRERASAAVESAWGEGTAPICPIEAARSAHCGHRRQPEHAKSAAVSSSLARHSNALDQLANMRGRCRSEAGDHEGRSEVQEHAHDADTFG